MQSLKIAFVILFAAGFVALIVFAWRQEKRRAREQAEHLLNRQAQRIEEPLPPLAADPDYQRLCRVLTEVLREFVSSPDLKLDPTMLRPTDVWWGEWDFDMDSLAHCELVWALEKEFHRDLKWHQFREAVTILDVYRILFPERFLEIVPSPEE